MKLYICVIETVPANMVPVLVAHATLRHHLQYQEDTRYQDWLKNSFRKCVVTVSEKSFSKIMQLPNVCLSWENTTLEGKTSCVTIIANQTEHNVLKFAKLWKP